MCPSVARSHHDLFQSEDWDRGHIYRYKVNFAFIIPLTFCIIPSQVMSILKEMTGRRDRKKQFMCTFSQIRNELMNPIGLLSEV